jgi:hypothetical protein
MSLGDQAGLKAVQELNEKTLPALTKAVEGLVEKIDSKLDEDLSNAVTALTVLSEKLVADLHGLLDRLNGISLNVPPRK